VIFVDTSFWVALRNARDPNHDQADALAVAHSAEQLVTTNHVRGETWTYLRRRAGHRSAVSFLNDLARAARLRIVHVSEEQEANALRWLRRHDEREYSLVDAASFEVMRSLRLHEALAFDGDFSAAGFVELRAPR
jgi:predicted nucleic acid-binding protein